MIFDPYLLYPPLIQPILTWTISHPNQILLLVPHLLLLLTLSFSHTSILLPPPLLLPFLILTYRLLPLTIIPPLVINLIDKQKNHHISTISIAISSTKIQPLHPPFLPQSFPFPLYSIITYVTQSTNNFSYLFHPHLNPHPIPKHVNMIVRFKLCKLN